MSNEARVLDSFGPNLVIETNGPVGVGGVLAYQLYATTDKGAKWQQALHGNGLSTMEASHTLEIQTGKKNKSGRVSFIAMAHHGDVCLNANSGWVRIKGKNIVIDATNQLLLQGKHIMVGNADKTTSDVQLLSRKIEINGSKEVKFTGTRKITRDSRNIFLKSSISQVQSPLQKVGFIRGAYRIKDSATRKDLGDEF
tara:strand:+ start:1162 stop:1752 length:591 start_codon:yes stop_codon:yes gene_type:complete